MLFTSSFGLKAFKINVTRQRNLLSFANIKYFSNVAEPKPESQFKSYFSIYCYIFFLDQIDNMAGFKNYVLHYNSEKIPSDLKQFNFEKDIEPTIKFLEQKAQLTKTHFSTLLKNEPGIFLQLESNKKYGEKEFSSTLKECVDYFVDEYEFKEKDLKCLLLRKKSLLRTPLATIRHINVQLESTYEFTKVSYF